MPDRAFTVANQITTLRLIFIPLFAILVVNGHYEGALAVLVAAAASDVVDGLVARLFHQKSSVGIALDPIADKILITTAYLVLSFRGALPWWLTFLVLIRDAGIIVTAALISLISGYRPFPPTILGKACTVSQVAAVLAAVSYKAHAGFITPTVVETFVFLAGILTVVSGIHYLIIGRRRYDPNPEDPSS
ncbi:MAG: CDP-alcohol phosphatidyltransferase family protein [Terriglobia bacterium]